MSCIVAITSQFGTPVIPDWNYPLDSNSQDRQAQIINWQAEIQNFGNESWSIADAKKIRMLTDGPRTVVFHAVLTPTGGGAFLFNGWGFKAFILLTRGGIQYAVGSGGAGCRGGVNFPHYVTASVTMNFLAGDFVQAGLTNRPFGNTNVPIHPYPNLTSSINGTAIPPTPGQVGTSQKKEYWGYAFGLNREQRIDRTIKTTTNPTTLNQVSYFAAVPVMETTYVAIVHRAADIVAGIAGDFRYDTVTYDPDGLFSSPSKFIVPADGVYLVDSLDGVSSNHGGDLITVAPGLVTNNWNGLSSELFGTTVGSGPGSSYFLSHTGICYMKAGAQVKNSFSGNDGSATVTQKAGASLSISGPYS